MPLRHTVEEIKLSNGIEGLLIDVPGTTVTSYDINFRAGNDYAQNPSIQQVAHIMEHLAFGPNKDYPTAEKFSQEFTKNGAYFNAHTYDRNMNYETESALMEWDRILGMERLSISEPRFTEASLISEKGNVREELTNQANNHGRVLAQAIGKAMGDTSFTDKEKVATIDTVALKDVKEHHKRTHTLKNMRFIVGGDLSKHKQEIIKSFMNWGLDSGEGRLRAKKSALHSSAPVYIYRKDLSNIIFHLDIALNRELSEHELMVASALTHILTGSFHSRIFGKARSKGLCYSMGSSVYADIDNVSEFEIYGNVSLTNADALFKLITSQLDKVTKGDLSQTELDDAKQYALGSYQMRAQTVDSIVGWYANEYFDHARIDNIESFPKNVESVMLDDIVTLTKEFLEEGVWTLGGIGNLSKDDLQGLYDLLAKVIKGRVE